MKLHNLLILPALALLAACKSKVPESDIRSVKIEAISFQTETMFSIACDKFDTYYADKWKARTITDKDSINKLNSLLTGLKRTNDAYDPDVRVKLLLTNNKGKIDTICLDEKLTRYKGGTYETSVELANFVQ